MPGSRRAIRVGDRDDRRVAHHVLHDLGGLADLGDLAAERAAREGVDREDRGHALAEAPDVGLVHRRLDLHPGEVLGDREERRRLEARRDRLPGVDGPRHDHAVHRRPDLRVHEVQPRLLERGLLLADRGLGRLELGLGHLERRLGRRDLGLGRARLRLARRQLGLRRPERRLPGALLGPGRLELGLRGVEGRLGLVALALRDELLSREVDPAVELEPRVARGRGVPGNVGLGGGDDRPRVLDVGPHPLDVGLGGRRRRPACSRRRPAPSRRWRAG